MLIYDALKKDHRELLTLLDKLIETGDDAKQRSSLVEKVRDALVPHSRAEEAIFYNSLREIDSSKKLAYHGYAEHVAAETLLRTLQASNAIDAGWAPIAKKLKDALEHHIREEEGEMFTVARGLFLDIEAEQMGQAFEKMKPEIKKGSFVTTTAEMIANMMPERLREIFSKSNLVQRV